MNMNPDRLIGLNRNQIAVLPILLFQPARCWEPTFSLERENTFSSSSISISFDSVIPPISNPRIYHDMKCGLHEHPPTAELFCNEKGVTHVFFILIMVRRTKYCRKIKGFSLFFKFIVKNYFPF